MPPMIRREHDAERMLGEQFHAFRPLDASATRRDEAFTLFAEAGLPTIPSGWFGMFLPVGAKPATVQMWNQALSEALAADDIKSRLADFGMSARSSSPQVLADLMRSDTAVWTDIVKRNNFEPLT